MTERLYYADSYLRGFTARITGHADEGRTVYLHRTVFYPTSGGQPFDTGSIAGVAMLDVVDEDERVAHKLAGAIDASVVEQGSVECAVDWGRRFDHMQGDFATSPARLSGAMNSGSLQEICIKQLRLGMPPSLEFSGLKAPERGSRGLHAIGRQ